MSAPDDPWQANAEWWAERFTDGADAEYEQQILPLVIKHLGPTVSSGVVVDIGCGEGQLSRASATVASTVIGVDTAPAMLEQALARGGGPAYLAGDALELPMADATADAVISCLVLEHLDDLASAIGEIARVLREGGRLLLFLNHPFLQPPGSGWVDDQIAEPPEQYWRVGPYLAEVSTVEQVDADVSIEFHHRPLSQYLNTAAAHGLVLHHMEEPVPPAEMYTAHELAGGAAEIPRLLFMVLERR